MTSKRGRKMKKGKFFVILFAAALLCLASCGIKDSGEDITTGPSETYPGTSVAVSVFMPITLTPPDGEDDETTDGFVAPIVERTTEKADEEISTAKITSANPTTTKITTTKPTTTKATTQAARQTVKVTVNEGDSLTQIFKKLDENGVADFDALMETAQTYDYSYYPLVAAIPSNANRCFKLEGYLYPDTYEFYTNQKPQDAIGKFLRNGKAKITDSMMSQASALGYSMDEVLTVASIIEKEGANSAEVAKIAAVIYNRLESGMKLQMDSSIYYIERHVKPYLTGDINRYNSYYNTYKCSALPAGPISNPGMRTIKAALEPADVPYLYFCHDENANYYYAETYEEHQENLKLAGIE